MNADVMVAFIDNRLQAVMTYRGDEVAALCTACKNLPSKRKALMFLQAARRKYVRKQDYVMAYAAVSLYTVLGGR